MGDPLSATAGVVGIAASALHGVRLVLDDLKEVAGAHETIETLRNDLAAVEAALTSFEGFAGDWEVLGKSLADYLEPSIRSCEKSCQLFRHKLQLWTRHSRTDGQRQLVVWDRINIGFFKQRQIKAMSEQMQVCKLTFNIVLDSATLYTSIRNTQATEELKQAIATNEVDISKALRAADNQLANIQGALLQFQPANGMQPDDQDTSDLLGTVQQLEEQVVGLSNGHALLETLLRKMQEANKESDAKEVQKSPVQVSFGHDNKFSGFQIAANYSTIDAKGMSFGDKMQAAADENRGFVA